MDCLTDLSLEDLKSLLEKWGEPAYHAGQIFSWIYKKGVSDFEAMSDLSSRLKIKLKENFCLFCLKLVKSLKSADGTEKFLFEVKDKNYIEAVIIPAQGRITGCISSQVGCKFGCSFCASGLLGFKRDLSCSEMIEEVLYLKNNSPDKKLSHIVFMGTGEPLDNYDNLLKAIRIINSKEALNIGARRITISSCGLIPGIKRLAEENLQVELSISLHAADNKIRSQIMPINKKYPLKDLLEACKDYIKKTNRQITFEYILFQGINSDLQSARNLSTILRNLNCKVNLIPTNPVKECGLKPPNKLEILLFRDFLSKHAVNVTLRKERGQDIEAACGQLRLRYANK